MARRLIALLGIAAAVLSVGLIVQRLAALRESNLQISSLRDQLSISRSYDFGHSNILDDHHFALIAQSDLPTNSKGIVMLVLNGGSDWRTVVQPWFSALRSTGSNAELRVVFVEGGADSAHTDVSQALTDLRVSFRLQRAKDASEFLARSALQFLPAAIVLTADGLVRAIALGTPGANEAMASIRSLERAPSTPALIFHGPGAARASGSPSLPAAFTRQTRSPLG